MFVYVGMVMSEIDVRRTRIKMVSMILAGILEVLVMIRLRYAVVKVLLGLLPVPSDRG